MSHTLITSGINSVQEYLRTNGHTPFKKEHGIIVREDANHIILNYDQKNANFNDPYAHVCRGLVLSKENYDVLGFGFHKFWNLNEQFAANIDWDAAVVQEKLDGTMVQRWWSPYTNRFEYSTRMIMGDRLRELSVGSSYVSKSNLSWLALIEQAINPILDKVNQSKNETCVFEVMSPYNQNVVIQSQISARLIARRDNISLQEEDVSHLDISPRVYKFNSLSDCVYFANSIKATEGEGFVVVDYKFDRIKIKGEEYVRCHQLGDSKSRSLYQIIEAVRAGETSEVSAYFPVLIPLFDEVEQLFADVIFEHQNAYEKVKDIELQKDFAIAVNKMKLNFPELLFTVRSGKSGSFVDAFNSLRTSKLEDYVKSKINKADSSAVADWINK